MQCPQCGRPIEEGKVFCKHCGARLAAASFSGRPQDLVGRDLGRYHITALVGRGGMATVYQAQHPGLNTTVAIKVLHSHLAGDPDFVARFHREARAVSTLRHPNLVRVLDFDNQGDLYYMVLEYIDGPPLATYLTQLSERGARLSPDETRRLFTPLCSALDYAHAQGMIHRDIKPSNILLTSDHVPVITDFGVAKIAGATSYTSPGFVVGSVHYMSPEQAQGLPADGRSDIYSLGVVLFEVVTGRVPFEGETPVSVIAQHLSSKVPAAHFLNPDVAPAMESVLDKVLAKDPADRYQKAGELAEALAMALRPDGAAASAAASAAAAAAMAETTRIPSPPHGPDQTPPGGVPGGQPPPGWIPEPPPRDTAKRGRGLFVGIAVVVILLLGGGSAGAFFLFGGDDSGGDTTTSGTVVATTVAPPDGTVVSDGLVEGGTTVTIPGYDPGGSTSTTIAPETLTTLEQGDYVLAMDDLEAVLLNCDSRVPSLAEKINATAPNVPASVSRELQTLFGDIDSSRQALGRLQAPPGYQEADQLIFQAADAMQHRIDQTMRGIDAMLGAGKVDAGHPYFDEGRKARDQYRQLYAQYKGARP